MTKVKFISFIPWVTIGSVIGSFFVVPMMPKVIDALYYKNKYNNEAVIFYKQYMDKFYRNNVINYLKYKMPKEEFERRFKKGK